MENSCCVCLETIEYCTVNIEKWLCKHYGNLCLNCYDSIIKLDHTNKSCPLCRSSLYTDSQDCEWFSQRNNVLSASLVSETTTHIQNDNRTNLVEQTGEFSTQQMLNNFHTPNSSSTLTFDHILNQLVENSQTVVNSLSRLTFDHNLNQPIENS